LTDKHVSEAFVKRDQYPICFISSRKHLVIINAGAPLPDPQNIMPSGAQFCHKIGRQILVSQ
jgi:hypothetical protein